MHLNETLRYRETSPRTGNFAYLMPGYLYLSSPALPSPHPAGELRVSFIFIWSNESSVNQHEVCAINKFWQTKCYMEKRVNYKNNYLSDASISIIQRQKLGLSESCVLCPICQGLMKTVYCKYLSLKSNLLTAEVAGPTSIFPELFQYFVFVYFQFQYKYLK